MSLGCILGLILLCAWMLHHAWKSGRDLDWVLAVIGVGLLLSFGTDDLLKLLFHR